MVRYCVTIGLLFSAVGLCAQETSTCFYLLRTGYLLEGTAMLEGRNYTVRTQLGSINVPVQNVVFVGNSKRDVYLYQRSQVDPANCNALIRFAEWCISNGLIDEGIAEYQQAGRVAPNAVFAGIVRQRLETLLQTEAAPPLSDAPAQPTILQTDAPAVSRAVLENFVRRVQPVLVNRCVSTDCHGTSSDHHFKMGIPQEIWGSTSRRNLQAALEYVNADVPMESPLLQGLVMPHGGARTVLSVESGQYIQAAQWVHQVARELSQEHSAGGASRIESVPPAETSMRVSTLPEQFRQAFPQAERLILDEPAHSGILDPLDPSVFNDKYHRESKPHRLFP